MRKVEVYAYLAEEESGGFSSGISTGKHTFTEKEYKEGKHLELTKGVKVLKGFYWCWYIKWIYSSQNTTT